MEFLEAMKEVDREDGFWAHLVANDGRTFSWKRYEELPDGNWSSRVLDEGDFNAYEMNNNVPKSLPWVTWVKRGAPNDLRFNLAGGVGGSDSITVRVLRQDGRKFSWVMVKEAAGGTWVETEEKGELNAYESNDRIVGQLPRIFRLVPRSIPGEYMFNGGL